MLSRRQIAIASGVVGIGLVSQAATCTAPNEQDLENALAAVIDKVSKAVKVVCGAVPVASFVVAVLQGLAPTNAAIATLEGFAQAAIDFISKQCPAPSPTPQARAPVQLNGKDIHPEWY